MTKYGPESKDLWIQARIDELMDDDDFGGDWEFQGGLTFREYAKQQATREHAEIEAMILNAHIDNLELG